ncbi:MAG: ribosome maturation factor RimP [Paucibacter sp.]|nr:ribosome maturation factor RimP [Roseateles sp.]
MTNWQVAVEKTVVGLGYELVSCERSAGGLLRVFIDKLSEPALAGEVITVDDCERVTRQLQYVLEVEACDYQRLEVSSPGVDRPLTKPGDYQRFVGEEVEITLKLAFQGRKKYRGVLAAQTDGDAGWRVVFNDGKVDQALDFTLDEVRGAKLVPALTFKGRAALAASQGAGGKAAGADDKAAKAAKPSKKKQSNAKARQSVEIADEDDKVDGGLDQ